jgi:ABC-2 type transport system ATP-binding protein
LAEVEEACARAIIISKGRVVADGALDEIRSTTGRVRYIITVDEQAAEGSHKPPTVAELKQALEGLKGTRSTKELPTDEKAHRFELSGAHDSDLRAELFRLMVQKGWTLLELRRDAQSLDAVFRELTRGDEELDRGRPVIDDEDDDNEADNDADASSTSDDDKE